MPETTWSDGDVVTATLLNQIEDQLIVRCTSSTRPTGTEGRVIYETDTGRLLINDGTLWRFMGGSTWNDFTPTFNNVSVSASDGAWRYSDGGMWVRFECTVSAAPTGSVTVNIPNSETKRSDGLYAFGHCWYVDATGADSFGRCLCIAAGATTIDLYTDASAAVDGTTPFTWASSDQILGQIFVPL